MKSQIAFALLGFVAQVTALAAADTITVCGSGCDAVTVTEGVAAASAGDTVLIHPGTYLEAATIFLDRSITVQGSGPGVTFVQLVGYGGIFKVSSAVPADTEITIENLNLSNGNAAPSGGGAAVAIYGVQSPATVEIIDCVLESNEAGYGGAISMSTSPNVHLKIDKALIRDNYAWTVGGAIRVYGGIVTISNSAIVGNAGWYSGGVFADYGTTLEIVNSTITGNTSENMDPGGVYGYYGSTVEISYTTIADNTGAPGYAAGVSSEGGTAVLTGCILSNPSGDNCSGTVTSGGFNVSSDSSCGFDATGDVSGQSAGLDAFVASGDYKSHYPLLVGSISRDRSNIGTHPRTDQRGASRPQDGDGNGSRICDSGAIEMEEGPFFTDDFESGNTDAWSTISP